ncbi:MAG: hypothetical protein ISR97_02670 [Nitrospira sp.]|nr:hypothetical protein [Nitrospira sp.]
MSPLSKKVVRCKGILVADSEIYTGVVETLSKEDIYLLAPPSIPDTDSSPGRPFRLVIDTPSGESVHVACRIKWSYKTPSSRLLNIVAEVTDSLSEYKDFYHRIN